MTITTWESGRESSLVDDILAGKKTIEGRLNRGKFAKYKPGDQVWLRRDYRDENGVLRDGEPRQVLVEVLAVRMYTSSLEMVTSEGFKRVMPRVSSAKAAADSYDLYYSPADQVKYGVLAIEFRVLSVART
jgi:ASC-1-like (ASCH) protein